MTSLLLVGSLLLSSPVVGSPELPGAAEDQPEMPSMGAAQLSLHGATRAGDDTRLAREAMMAQTVASGVDADAADTGEPAEQPRSWRRVPRHERLGGFRLMRVGVAAKAGYTNGTSATQGLFSRDQTLQDSLDSGTLSWSSGGSGTDSYGGFAYGFLLDAELVGLNLWFDFHKFTSPGGLWSLLLGYDHEFGFGRRLRLDVGLGAGVTHMYFGQLAQAIADPFSNETADLGAAGLEGRVSADLHIKLVGPLYTGPSAMVGYHYLWAATTSDVTIERGMHYSFGWTLRVDLATPRLGKRRRS